MSDPVEGSPHVDASDFHQESRETARDIGRLEGMLQAFMAGISREIQGFRTDMQVFAAKFEKLSGDLGRLEGQVDSMFTAVSGVAAAKGASVAAAAVAAAAGVRGGANGSVSQPETAAQTEAKQDALANAVAEKLWTRAATWVRGRVSWALANWKWLAVLFGLTGTGVVSRTCTLPGGGKITFTKAGSPVAAPAALPPDPYYMDDVPSRYRHRRPLDLSAERRLTLIPAPVSGTTHVKEPPP